MQNKDITLKERLLDIIVEKGLIKTHRINDEFVCAFNFLLDNEPSCYWNREIYEIVYNNLNSVINNGKIVAIKEELLEFYLSGYSAYLQVTDSINELSDVSYNNTLKNRQYRIPTYVSIVEGCLTNLYRFILSVESLNTNKDYSNQNKLNPISDALVKLGYEVAVEKVDVNIRNAINHGGVIFKENGNKIDFYYNKSGCSYVVTQTCYEFDSLIDDVYDTASSVVLAITSFLNDNWDKVTINRNAKSYVAYSLLAMKLSVPTLKCYYISESISPEQLNAEFWIKEADKSSIIKNAVILVISIYRYYPGYHKYYISFNNERLQTSWIRFSNTQIARIINDFRDIPQVVSEILNNSESMIFEQSKENIDVREVKYFKFPDYTCLKYQIRQITDSSLENRKRLKCNVYIGELSKKEEIVEIIREAVNWVKKLRNVDSLTIHRKNGTMEADAVYMNVYRYDTRRKRAVSCNNENFICFVDYNQSGNTTLKDGGFPQFVWNELCHEKIDNMYIAWREKKYKTRRTIKIGANDLCLCGSGKKYKKCCGLMK